MALGTAAILTALILATATFTGGFNVSPITFDEGFTPLFGEKNIVQSAGGRTVQILLDKFSGSGFISSGLYYNGFFSASIKLPSDFTAGVVVAFYMSNGDIFEKNHDELDFEFLGNVRGKEWRVQTNVYGNGSTNRGREERYRLPFDPTAEAHRYTILWTQTNIVFYIDDSPIREVVRSDSMGGDYPSKPMSVYATIWDGSAWATSGGRYKVDYKYAPFIAEFTGLALQGCRLDPVQQLPAADQCRDAANYSSLSPEKRQAMLRFRENYMTYTCCYDHQRYPVPLPDCYVEESQKARYSESGEVTVQPKQIYTSYVRRQRGRSGRRGRLKSSRAAASGKRVQALA